MQLRGATQVMPNSITFDRFVTNIQIPTANLTDREKFILRDGSVPFTGNISATSATFTELLTAHGGILVTSLNVTAHITQTGAGSLSTGSGPVTLNGNVTVTGSKTFSVGTGATVLGGTLSVAGAAALAGNLSVGGDLNVTGAGALSVGTGPASLGGPLTSVGTATLGTGVGVGGASVDASGRRVANVADPVSPQDSATKAYVDGVASGLNIKNSVRYASAPGNNVNLAVGGLNQTLDGGNRVLASGDRILLKNQNAPAQNGIYHASAGAWTRVGEANTWAELISAFVFVESGSAQADSGWVCTVDGGGVLGTSAVDWVQFSGAGSYSAGAGLVQTGTTFSVGAGAGVSVSAREVALNPHPTGGLAVEATGISVRHLPANATTKSGTDGLSVRYGPASGLDADPQGLKLKVAGAALRLDTSGLSLGTLDSVPLAGGALSSGRVLIGQGGVAAAVTISGDATLSDAGVLTLSGNVLRETDFVWRETPAGAVNGTNGIFTLANVPLAGTEQVYVNGILQEPGATNDYTILGAKITLTYALQSAPLADRIRVSYIKP